LWKLAKSAVRNASASSCSRQTIEKKVEISNNNLQQVPKIPREDFPAEMTHGINRDPSMKDDYNTIFTPEGATVCRDVITSSNDSKEDSTTTSIEDGNVDYCSECQKTGDIICCDVCPRGFHAVCLALDTSTLAGRWECPRCLQDSTQQPQDLVEGTYYLDKLKSVFEQFSSTKAFEQKVGTLSKIFDAIMVLTEYEFGNIFSEPVDVKAVRDYKKYVKRPMDLGTITSRLLKGSYCKASSRTKDRVGADGITEMDVVILNVLKDIEQIWHNCFLYNREGEFWY
jgi:Transcription factor involved in chromatin remodeling, contains bromodomain